MADFVRISFQSLIALWPSHEAMAREVGGSLERVHKWAQRRRIPSRYWAAVLRSPVAVTHGITAETLVSAARQAAKRSASNPRQRKKRRSNRMAQTSPNSPS